VLPDGETHAANREALRLLHADDHPWFVLAHPPDHAPVITEVGAAVAHAGLSSLVLRYADPDAGWVDVGWTVRPVRADIRADEDDALTASDMAQRLVLGVLEDAAGAATYRPEILRRFNAAPPAWAAARIAIDGVEHPAFAAVALDARLTHALLGDQVVFVHSSGWSGSVALRRTLDRPPLPPA